MSESSYLIKECNTKDGTETIYGKLVDGTLGVKECIQTKSQEHRPSTLRKALNEVFLPRGYPESVSTDYASYQIWDTLQACCSTFSGMLAVQSVLKGVGVGQETATPLAAALTWFMKDGVGMVTGIFFAWWKGCFLDSDCKKWRLFADFVNDAALCLELSVSDRVHLVVPLLCLSSSLKALVGVAGGATRTAITHHQARCNNAADVAAKDGSQETLVNLVSMSVGVWLLHTSIVQSNMWYFMVLLVALHLVCNFKAVKSLCMTEFNEERFLISIRHFLMSTSVPSVEEVNSQESVIVGCGLRSADLCGFSICLGASLDSNKIDSHILEDSVSVFRDKNFLLLPILSKRKILVVFKKEVTGLEILLAYYEAVCLAFLFQEEENSVSTIPIFDRWKRAKEERFPGNSTLSKFRACREVFEPEFTNFQNQGKRNGWHMDNHLLHLDQWRADWGSHKKAV